MAIENLSKEIANSAESEAKAIIKKAKEEADSIIAEAESEAEAIRSGQSDKANREAAQISVELVASARQANQKRILIARREELDATWDAVRAEVESASLKGRTSILKGLLSAASAMSSGGEVLRPVAIDRKVLEKESKGYSIGEDIDGLGGFVLEASDGSVSLDFRFDGLIQDSWSKNMAAVSETLFE